MNDSIRLGRISGIPFGVHWSLLVFATFGVWNLAAGLLPYAAPEAGPIAVFVAAVVGILGLFASIVAHELGHAVTAQRRGVEVDGITLWMLGGVARLRTDAASARAAAAIAAAGPAVSVALGVVLTAVAVLAALLGVGALGTALLTYLAFINVALALFNLIPALPLDGGRLYQAWLWHRGGDRHRATIRAAGLGRLLGWGLVLLGLTQVLFAGNSGFWLMLLGSFVVSLAGAERRRAQAEYQRARLERIWMAPPPAAATTVVDVRSAPTGRVAPPGRIHW